VRHCDAQFSHSKIKACLALSYIAFPLSAQCYPRLACPLYAPFFMQLHEPGKAGPGVGWRGICSPAFCMQIHAPYACMALYKPAGQKKGAGRTKDGDEKAADFSGRYG